MSKTAINVTVAAGRGSKGDICPGWYCAWGGIWRSKNMEF